MNKDYNNKEIDVNANQPNNVNNNLYSSWSNNASNLNNMNSKNSGSNNPNNMNSVNPRSNNYSFYPKDTSSNEEKPYLILNDEQLKVKRRKNKALSYFIYVFFIGVGLLVFYMYRLDKYEFYLKNTEILLANNSEYQVELIPKNAIYFDYLNYKYEIEDENIATVDKYGQVVAKREGETKLKIKYKNGFSYKTVNIKSQNIDVYEVGLKEKNKNEQNISITEDESTKIEAKANGSNDLNINVKYRSSNEEVALVDEYGNITPVGPGEAVIVGESPNGTIGEKEIVVEKSKIEVEKIELRENKITLKRGTSSKIIPIIIPENAETGNIKYESNNDNVSVDSTGNIVGNKVGNSMITITTENGTKAYCNIEVKEDSIPITSIDINPNGKEIKKGEKFQIEVTINPSNATERDFIIESSNENILKVTNGLVYGVGVGRASITVRTKDNRIKESIWVNVKDNNIAVLKLEIKDNKVNIKKGSSYSIPVVIEPSNATNKKLTYKSNNGNVSVDATGVVKGITTGKSIVTITSSNGLSANVEFNVQEEKIEISKLTLNKTQVEMNVSDNYQLQTNIEPSNANVRNLTWKSSNEKVATVSNGKIVAKGGGTADITVISANGKSASCKVKVNVLVNSLSITGSSSVKIKNSTNYSVSLVPSNATNKTVTWTSSNTSVATVNNKGVVTGVNLGTSIIIAKSSNGKEARKTITVESNEIVVQSIQVQPKSVKVKEGKSVSLVASINPANATNKSVNWSSSNKSIATVDSKGVVKGLKAGKVTITAKSVNGKSASGEVIVEKSEIAVSSVALNITNTKLMVGTTIKLNALITPTNATNKSVNWSSSNKGIATVDGNGYVSCIKEGTAVITAKTSNGKSASCVILVIAKDVPVNFVSLNNPNPSIMVGDDFQLRATISPENATNKGIMWTSSNPNVATVNNGVVRGINVGETTITATASNGISASAVVIVNYRVIPVQSVTLNRSNYVISVNESFSLSSTILPNEATNKNIVWTSSNPNVARVDQAGNVVGIAVGTTNIAATVDGVSATCLVEVSKDQIHFIDIGFAGNAILLDSGNKFVLIDAGNTKDESGSYVDFGKNKITTYFTKVKYTDNGVVKTGINKLDAVVVSHMHYDHAKSMADIIRKYKPTTVYMKNYTQSISFYNEIKAAAVSVGSTIVNPTEKQEVLYGHFTLKFYNTKERILNPKSGVSYSDNINSLVVMASLDKGDKKYLAYIPGDLEKDGGVVPKDLSTVIANDFGLSSQRPLDVYVAAHHGYYDNDSPSPDLQAVNNRADAIEPLHIKNAVVPNTTGWFCQKEKDRKYIGLLNIYNNLKNNGGNTNIYFSNAKRVKITFNAFNMVIDGGEVIACNDTNCSDKTKVHNAVASIGQKANKCTRTPY